MFQETSIFSSAVFLYVCTWPHGYAAKKAVTFSVKVNGMAATCVVVTEMEDNPWSGLVLYTSTKSHYIVRNLHLYSCPHFVKIARDIKSFSPPLLTGMHFHY
jgi:hypothetical protein